MFKYYGIDWIWYATSLLSIYLLGKKNKFGFACMMVSDCAGLYMAYATESVAGLVGSLAYLILSLKGWKTWADDERVLAQSGRQRNISG